METIISRANEIFDYPLFHVHGSTFTVGTLLYLIISAAIVLYASGRLKRWIVQGPFGRRQPDVGVRTAIGSIIRYLVVLVGFLVIVQTAGINLSSLTILVSAFGIGIGFGLQNVTNNFVSGLIILLERPIKVGDRIEVGEVMGEIAKISPRATTVQSNDNISHIVPNSEFITSRVINWSHSDLNVRLHLPVGVSYGSDPETVKRLLLEVAAEHSGVLREPPPDLIFKGFGDSSLDFDLRIWTTVYISRPAILKSDLYFAIWKKFKENGIEIPFPQRDIHIKDERGRA
jgi:small-conductance mechanosensitive channel